MEREFDFAELNLQLQRLMDLAYMVAKDKKTKVILGKNWYYDETRNLISVAPLISVDDYEMAKGVLCHEIGHKKYTDFKAWFAMLGDGGKYKGNKLFHRCLNTIEDIYVENRMAQVYGGFNEFMAMANENINAKYAVDPDKVHPFSQRVMAIYDWARGYTCPFPAVPEMYRDFAARAAAIKRSGMNTTVALAEELYEAIKEEFKEELKKAKAGKDGWMPEDEIERDPDHEPDEEPAEREPNKGGDEDEEAEPSENEGEGEGATGSAMDELEPEPEPDEDAAEEGSAEEGADGEGAEEGEGDDGEGEGNEDGEGDPTADGEDAEEDEAKDGEDEPTDEEGGAGDEKDAEEDKGDVGDGEGGEPEPDEDEDEEGKGGAGGDEDGEGGGGEGGDMDENDGDVDGRLEGEPEPDEEPLDPTDGEGEAEPKEGAPEEGAGGEEEAAGAFDSEVDNYDGGIDPIKEAQQELAGRVDGDLLGKLELVRPPIWFDAADLDENPYEFNADFRKRNQDTRVPRGWYKNLGDDTRKLYMKLQNVLLEACQTEHLRGMPQGRLHGASLHKIRHGEFKVFQKKVRGMDASQIAVAIVVDCSGSMGGRNAAAARDTAYIMGETLHKCGVKFGVYGYTSAKIGGSDYPINLEFKNMTDSWIGRKDTLRHLGAYRNNYDGASLLEIYKRLIAVNAKRRIMIVISDGIPAPENTTYLKNLVPVLMQGVDVVGVGLDFTGIDAFYPVSVKCDVRDLAEKLAPVLQSLMMDKRIKRGGRDIALVGDPTI